MNPLLVTLALQVIRRVVPHLIAKIRKKWLRELFEYLFEMVAEVELQYGGLSGSKKKILVVDAARSTFHFSRIQEKIGDDQAELLLSRAVNVVANFKDTQPTGEETADLLVLEIAARHAELAHSLHPVAARLRAMASSEAFIDQAEVAEKAAAERLGLDDDE